MNLPGQLAWAVLASLLLVGCSWREHSGVRHTLVLGVGYFSTAESPVKVSDVRVLGLIHSENGSALGYTRQHSVDIDPQEAGDAVVSVHTTPFSLRVQNFDCSLTNSPPKHYD